MQRAATIELILCWLAWAYPFVFRAPHYQKRASTVATASTLVGLALECAGIFIAVRFYWRPASQPPGIARILGSMALEIGRAHV